MSADTPAYYLLVSSVTVGPGHQLSARLFAESNDKARLVELASVLAKCVAAARKVETTPEVLEDEINKILAARKFEEIPLGQMPFVYGNKPEDAFDVIQNA